MREVISDVVKHTGGLGFIDIVKITGSDTETKIEAMDNDKTVIVKGKLNEPLAEFEGEFGMGNLSLIKGLVDHANFRTDGAKVEVIRETDPTNANQQIPTEMLFIDEQGQDASYRFMSTQLVPSQAKFLGTTWDITVNPSKSKISEFSSFASLYSAFETLFMVDVREGNLRFNIGDPSGNSHKASVIIEKEVEGKMSAGLYWPISQVLNILKLGIDENVKMNFSSKGALMIELSNDISSYQYILPAKKR